MGLGSKPKRLQLAGANEYVEEGTAGVEQESAGDEETAGVEEEDGDVETERNSNSVVRPER